MTNEELDRVKRECGRAIAEYEEEARVESSYADMLRDHADAHDRKADYADQMIRRYREYLAEAEAGTLTL